MATNRQHTALQKVVENGGNVSRAMREAGYSAAMCKNPQKLKASKAWKDILDSKLDNLTLVTKLREMIEGDDMPAVAKSLDMAFRIKGLYAKTPKQIKDPLEDLFDDELNRQLQSAEAELAVRGVNIS